VITRIAPTPSGYLHLGNCVNFVLVDRMARAQAGRVVLRIDDLDAARYRPEYVDDIFRVLEWLDIAWHVGPRSREEFESDYAMRSRSEYYRAELGSMSPSLETYACECSRADLHAAHALGCVRGCADRDLALQPGRSALRVRVRQGTTVAVGDIRVDISAEVGDFVLWRRDDRPAYQLASVIEDRDLGVTDVIRGMDLLPSTAAQLLIAPALGAESLARASFHHHALVQDDAGHKLSKSQLGSIPLSADDATRRRIEDLAMRLAEDMSISSPAAPR
jgi:glutamyl-tRNA synthetase